MVWVYLFVIVFPCQKQQESNFCPEYGTGSLEELEAKYWMGTNSHCQLEEEN